jgi:hypothetical protein
MIRSSYARVVAGCPLQSGFEGSCGSRIGLLPIATLALGAPQVVGQVRPWLNAVVCPHQVDFEALPCVTALHHLSSCGPSSNVRLSWGFSPCCEAACINA